VITGVRLVRKRQGSPTLPMRYFVDRPASPNNGKMQIDLRSDQKSSFFTGRALGHEEMTHSTARSYLILSRATASGKPAMNKLRSYSHADDAELITRSASGDRRAFDEIVVRHGPFALRLALRLIPDRLAAEDAVQEAMVRAWSRAGDFDPRRGRFTTWLYRIVVNFCIDQRRRVRPDPLPDGFDPIDPAVGADETLVLRERHAVLADALRQLPARQRAAMTLVYDEGLSSIEAAGILGVSAKAIERLLARARASLRERLTVGFE
jgi:RNA polymerase sigma-70 factor, ECF subfamily